MSRSRWIRCPLTGIPVGRFHLARDEFLDDEEAFDRRLLPDCNVFDVRTIAYVAGFSDYRYVRDVVLSHPECPIHVHRLPLISVEGRLLDTVIATYQSSVHAGGQMWAELVQAKASERGHAAMPRLQVNSFQVI